jgi:hypothetical protein
MSSSLFLRISVKTAVSLLAAGMFYAAWLAVYLVILRLEHGQLERALFILAPVVTAAGFATGTALVERVRNESRTGFFLSWVWSLSGCAIGAIAVYWYGPMLIVFTMLAGGTIAVAYRDFSRTRSRRRHSF